MFRSHLYYQYSPGLVNVTGNSGSFMSTPDSAATSPTTDIDIKTRLACDDWTGTGNQMASAKWDGGSGQRCWLARIEATTGILRLYISANGSGSVNAVSTAAPPLTDGVVSWLRWAFDDSENTVNFYYSTETTGDVNSVTWTQLGDADVALSSVGIFDGSSKVTIGASEDDGSASLLTGKVYNCHIASTVGSATYDVCDLNILRDAPLPGAKTFTDRSGAVWTVNGDASFT